MACGAWETAAGHHSLFRQVVISLTEGNVTPTAGERDPPSRDRIPEPSSPCPAEQ